MSSITLHESPDLLSEGTKDLHRAIVSLMEELEAIDWYQQRVDATNDPALKEVLAHNMREEIEHAMMNLEWIRRAHPTFDENARRYLFTEGAITKVEEDSEDEARAPAAAQPVSLGIGSLKAR